MINPSTTARSFWAPLYFEPLLGSGERFCVAIAVIWDSGAKVVTAPGINRLNCLFGHQGDFLISIVEQVTRDIEDRLQDHLMRAKIIESRHLDSPNFLPQGFYCGEFIFAKGDQHDRVISNALLLCSSFATAYHTTVLRPRTDRVVSSMKKIVTVSHNHLKKCFNVQAPTFTQGTQPHFGFIGTNLAANMGRLNSNLLSEHFPHFQAKAMDLEKLRENQQRNLFDLPIQKFSLFALLVKSEENDERKRIEKESRLQETLAALEEIARERALQFVSNENLIELAQVLLDQEEEK